MPHTRRRCEDEEEGGNSGAPVNPDENSCGKVRLPVVGDVVDVAWDDRDETFRGVLGARVGRKKGASTLDSIFLFRVDYYDGDVVQHDLDAMRWRFVQPPSPWFYPGDLADLPSVGEMPSAGIQQQRQKRSTVNCCAGSKRRSSNASVGRKKRPRQKSCGDGSKKRISKQETIRRASRLPEKHFLPQLSQACHTRSQQPSSASMDTTPAVSTLQTFMSTEGGSTPVRNICDKNGHPLLDNLHLHPEEKGEYVFHNDPNNEEDAKHTTFVLGNLCNASASVSNDAGNDNNHDDENGGVDNKKGADKSRGCSAKVPDYVQVLNLEAVSESGTSNPNHQRYQGQLSLLNLQDAVSPRGIAEFGSSTITPSHIPASNITAGPNHHKATTSKQAVPTSCRTTQGEVKEEVGNFGTSAVKQGPTPLYDVWRCFRESCVPLRKRLSLDRLRSLSER